MSDLFDPFDGIPDHPVRPKEERPELERHGKKILAEGEGDPKRAKPKDFGPMTVKHFEKLGAVVAPAQHFHQRWGGGGFYRDMFGIVDHVAVMPFGDVYFLQSTSKSHVREHVRKVSRGTFGPSKDNQSPILSFVERLWQNPRAKLVVVGWEKTGARWGEPEFFEVTRESVAAVMAAARKK